MPHQDAQVLRDYARLCRATGKAVEGTAEESPVYEAMARSAEDVAARLVEHGLTMAELVDGGEG